MNKPFALTSPKWTLDKSNFDAVRKTAEVQLFRQGVFAHWAGAFTLDDDFYDKIIGNYRQVILEEQSLDLGHSYHPDDHAGWFRSLYRVKDELWGSVYNIPPHIAERIENDDLRYISPAFYTDYEPPEKPGTSVGPVFVGAALTNRPFLSGMQGIRMNSHTNPAEHHPVPEQISCGLFLDSRSWGGIIDKEKPLTELDNSTAAGRGGNTMEWKDITAEELAKNRPDLLLSAALPAEHPKLVELSTAQGTATKLQSDMKTLQDDKAKVEADLSKAQNDLKTAEAVKLDLEKKITELGGTVEQKDKAQEELATKLDSMNTTITQLADTVKKLDATFLNGGGDDAGKGKVGGEGGGGGDKELDAEESKILSLAGV